MKYRTPHHKKVIATAIASLVFASVPALAEQTATLGTIVVTAQKITEDVQKVPLSITSLSGDSIMEAGVKNAMDLQGLINGINVIQQGPGASLQIRGVGSNTGGGNIDPSVAFTADGVYQSRPASALGLMYDIERVEVLKGPQGTLYGRNATVGAVNVISRNPTDKKEGEVEFELGNYAMRRGTFAFNLPVNDAVKVRVAGQAIKHNGYLSDGYNDADDQAARFKLSATPNKDFSILLTVDTHEKHGNGGGNIFTGTVSPNGLVNTPMRDSSDPWTLSPVVLSPPHAAAAPATVGLGSASQIGTGHAEPANLGLDMKNQGVSANIDWNLGSSKLTLIPAYRSSYVLNQGYTSGTLMSPYSTYNLIDQTQKSFEARLTSNAIAPFKWLVGYYTIDEDAPTLFAARSANPLLNGAGSTTYTDMKTVNSKSQAIFGQATYALAEATRGTLGLRHTSDDKHQDGRMYQTSTLSTDGSGALNTFAGAPASYAINSSYSNSSLNYKLGLDHDLDKNSMVYASLSTGYKSGGLNFSPVSSAAGDRHEFKPEKLLALAFGGKSRQLNNRLQVNGELYFWRYQDQQVAVVDELDSPTGIKNGFPANVLFLNNSGTSSIWGADLDTVYKLTPDDRISASLAYMHARNGDFVIKSTQMVTPVCIPGPVGCFNVVTPLEATTDVSGKVLPFSPTWALTLAYSHSWTLADGGYITATIDGHAESESYVNYHLQDPERQPGYFRGNLYLSYGTADGRISVTGYARNFTNQAVLTRGSVGGGSLVSAPAHYAAIMDPRTYGVTVNFKF